MSSQNISTITDLLWKYIPFYGPFIWWYIQLSKQIILLKYIPFLWKSVVSDPADHLVVSDRQHNRYQEVSQHFLFYFDPCLNYYAAVFSLKNFSHASTQYTFFVSYFQYMRVRRTVWRFLIRVSPIIYLFLSLISSADNFQ